MKLLKYALASMIALTLSGCGNDGPSESIVETKVFELIQNKVHPDARDSLALVKSACEPKEQENVWRCVVTVKIDFNGQEEKNTMSYIFKKNNDEWFAHGPKPVSADERNAFEGVS